MGWFLLVLVVKVSVPEKDIYIVGKYKKQMRELTRVLVAFTIELWKKDNHSPANCLWLTSLLWISKKVFLCTSQAKQHPICLCSHMSYVGPRTKSHRTLPTKDSWQSHPPPPAPPPPTKAHSCFFLFDLFVSLAFPLGQWNILLKKQKQTFPQT